MPEAELSLDEYCSLVDEFCGGKAVIVLKGSECGVGLSRYVLPKAA